MPIVVRPAALGELPALSALCLRSKAVWGYDAAFMEACRDELTLRPDELVSTRIAVAENENGMAGVVQVAASGAEAHLLKLFIEPTSLRGGTGRVLFSWATLQARDLRTSRLIIEADPDAAPFYRRMGAIDTGVAPSGSIPGRMLPRLAIDLG